MFYPFKLVPAYQDYLWGGSKLKESYGKQTTLSPLAESWELSCHPNGESKIAGGTFSGRTLKEYLTAYDSAGLDAVGTLSKHKGQFPLLIKWIDAAQKLSVQVHPDDAYASTHENGAMGKTEMWYIASAAPGAKLIYGFSRDVSRQEFKNAIAENKLEEILHSVPVKKGDCIFIPAGLVHAIGEGLVIVEIQQSSDLTYRVYDWGRVDQRGNARPLHIERALDVANLSRTRLETSAAKPLEQIAGGAKTLLQKGPYFCVTHYRCDNVLSLEAAADTFHCLTMLDGACEIAQGDYRLSLQKGDSAFLPANSGKYTLSGTAEFLCSSL